MKRKRYFITNPVIFVSQPEIKGEEMVVPPAFPPKASKK